MLLADGSEWIFYVVAVVAIVAIVVWVSAARAKKRMQGTMAAASGLGFTYAGNAWPDPSQSADLVTSLFNTGKRRDFKNIMTGNAGEFRAAIFDYSYITGSGQSQQHIMQTVASFAKNGVTLPMVAVAPAGLMSKLFDKMFARNIAFDTRPEFSKVYHVFANDEAAVRALFTPLLFAFFETLDPSKKWHVECAGRSLILYRSGKRVDPKDLKDFRDETTILAGKFFGSLSAP